MKTKQRILLHRKLRELDKQLSWPAVYTSKQLSQELKRERELIDDKLRDLPLAG